MNLFTLFSFLAPKAFADTAAGVINGVYNPYGTVDNQGGGLNLLLGNVLRLFFVVAGIIAFFNFIIAGFQYMMAAGDSKKLQEAWDRIWQSLLGLILVVGSFAIASIFSYLIFGNAAFMLQPQIFGPGQ